MLSFMIFSTVSANPVWRGQDDSIIRPKICPTDQFVIAMRCTGGYCGKLDIQCARHTGITWGGNMAFLPYLGNPLKPATVTRDHRDFFTRVTSGRDKRIDKVRCPDGMAITGLNCAGKNCGMISVLCAQIRGASLNSCQNSGSFSEEQGGVMLLDRDRLIRGMSCKGKYCDNITLNTCRRSRNTTVPVRSN
jgi:hypothetical protein